MSIYMDYQDAISTLETLAADIAEASDAITTPKLEDGSSTAKATYADALRNVGAALNALTEASPSGDRRTLTRLARQGA
jgi:hypothetical protein